MWSVSKPSGVPFTTLVRVRPLYLPELAMMFTLPSSFTHQCQVDKFKSGNLCASTTTYLPSPPSLTLRKAKSFILFFFVDDFHTRSLLITLATFPSTTLPTTSQG